MSISAMTLSCDHPGCTESLTVTAAEVEAAGHYVGPERSVNRIVAGAMAEATGWVAVMGLSFHRRPSEYCPRHRTSARRLSRLAQP